MNQEQDLKIWLFKKFNNYNDLTIKDILDEYCYEIYEWLLKNNNLQLKDDFNSFKIKFYLFNYNKYGI